MRPLVTQIVSEVACTIVSLLLPDSMIDITAGQLGQLCDMDVQDVMQLICRLGVYVNVLALCMRL